MKKDKNSKKVAMCGLVRMWQDDLLVEYIDRDGNESSFVIKNTKDINALKNELVVAKQFSGWTLG